MLRKEMIMSEFETTACKVLGVILFLLIMSMILQIAMGCNPPRPEMEGEPIPEYIDEVDTDHLT